MAIVNRDKDDSEQKEVIVAHYRTVNVSALLPVWVAPYPCALQKVNPIHLGCSGSPVYTFEKLSIGASGVGIGISGMVGQNFGTSGSVAFSGLAAAGSTLLALAKGDMIQVIASGANTAATDLVLELVIDKSQDIVSYF